MLLYCLVSFALLLYGVIGVAITSPALNPRSDPTPAATFTIGPMSSYIPLRITNSVPSGTSVMIYPSGVVEEIPGNGIDIAFGPDAQKKMADIIQNQCTQKQADQCRNALAQLLQQSDVSVHAKRFSSLSLARIPEIIAEFFYLANRPPPKIIHFNADDLEQINSISTASVIAFVTGAANSDLGTMTVNPAPTSTEKDTVAVTTLSHDGAGHKQGDAVIDFPADLSVRLEDFIAQMGGSDVEKACPNGKASTNKRVDVIERCLRAMLPLADIIMQNGPNPFNQLIPANQQNGQAVPAVQELVLFGVPLHELAFRRARQRPELAQLQDAVLRTLARVVLVKLWDILLNHHHGVTIVVIPRNDILQDQTDDGISCPQNLICPDDDCKGDQGPPSVIGYCSVEGKNFMCPCEEVMTPFVYEFSESQLNEQQAFLKELAGIADLMATNPVCDLTEKVDAETSWFTDQTAKVCISHDELRKRDGGGANGLLSWGTSFVNNSLVWKFGWKDTGGCGFDCDDVFARFTSSTSCAYDSHVMASSGSITTTCGIASYGISNLPTQYNMSLHQEMDGANSFIEWSVYASGTNERLEGPNRGSSPTSQSYQLTIYVDNPTDTKTTNIRFAAAAKAGDPEATKWSTGTTGNGYTDQIPKPQGFQSAWCGASNPGSQWVSKGSGWARDIYCFYPNDFAKLPK